MKKLLTYFIVLVFFLSFMITEEVVTANTNAEVIYIDPGHGGADGGATINNIKEADLNLAIALKLKTIYENNGYSVLLTRDGDYDLATDPNNRKRTDIRKRVELINASKASYFISVHMNSFSDSKYRGSQVFYSSVNEQSFEYAKKIQESLKYYLSNTTREAKVISNIYLLDHVVIPGVLVECGFLSNSEELELLKDSNYQLKIAYSIYYGFCDYMI